MTARRITLLAFNLALMLVLLSIWRTEPQGITAVNLVSVDSPRASHILPVDGHATPAAVTAKALFRSPRVAVKMAPNEPPPPPAPKPPFWLVGVVWGETERFAIIQSSQNSPIRRVRTGEMIERWRLENLNARVATFRMGDLTVPLDLQRTHSPGTNPAQNAYGRLRSH